MSPFSCIFFFFLRTLSVFVYFIINFFFWYAYAILQVHSAWFTQWHSDAFSCSEVPSSNSHHPSGRMIPCFLYRERKTSYFMSWRCTWFWFGIQMPLLHLLKPPKRKLYVHQKGWQARTGHSLLNTSELICRLLLYGSYNINKNNRASQMQDGSSGGRQHLMVFTAVWAQHLLCSFREGWVASGHLQANPDLCRACYCISFISCLWKLD